MVCPACGAPVAEGLNFCAQCGAKIAAAPPAGVAYPSYPPAAPMPVPRVRRHLQTLGILWCVFGVYRIASGLMGMLVLRVVTLRGFGMGDWPFNSHSHGAFGPPWMGSLLPFIAGYTIVTAALALLVGYSLLTRQQWGRTLGIVVGILTLFKPILGTALGIYTLWVLAPSYSGAEYDGIADRS